MHIYVKFKNFCLQNMVHKGVDFDVQNALKLTYKHLSFQQFFWGWYTQTLLSGERRGGKGGERNEGREDRGRKGRPPVHISGYASVLDGIVILQCNLQSCDWLSLDVVFVLVAQVFQRLADVASWHDSQHWVTWWRRTMSAGRTCFHQTDRSTPDVPSLAAE